MKYFFRTLTVLGISALLFSSGTVVYAQTANPYSCATKPTLRKGSQGTCVQAAQWYLNQGLSPSPNLLEDAAEFDEAMEVAVKKWQTYNGLTPDGVIGSKTWSSFTCVNWDDATASCKDATPTNTNATNTTNSNQSKDCAKLEQNFKDFAGGTPGPLANNCYGPGEAVAKAINIATTWIGAVTVLFIVIGAYRYILSRGDEKAAAAGKNTMKWGIIGLVVVLAAYMIVTVATRLVTTSQLF